MNRNTLVVSVKDYLTKPDYLVMIQLFINQQPTREEFTIQIITEGFGSFVTRDSITNAGIMIGERLRYVDKYPDTLKEYIKSQ